MLLNCWVLVTHLLFLSLVDNVFPTYADVAPSVNGSIMKNDGYQTITSITSNERDALLPKYIMLQMEKMKDRTKSHKSFQRIYAHYHFINSVNISVAMLRDYGRRTIPSLRFVHIPKTGVTETQQ